MDPEQTLRDILDAFIEETQSIGATYPRDEAIDALANLCHWLRKSGAMPHVSCENGVYKIGK